MSSMSKTIEDSMLDIPLTQKVTALIPTVILAATAILFFQVSKKSSSSTRIPRVPAYIPFLGSTIEYFTCLSAFCEKYRKKHGDVFYATILGNDWLFVHNKNDFETVVKSSEKQLSMYQAFAKLAAKFLPRENESEYINEEMRKACSRGINWEGVSSTPHFIYALKPARLKTWIPTMKKSVIEHYFVDIPDSGTMDVFDFCFKLVSGMTAAVLLGSRVANDERVLKEWVELVRSAEPETAFAGPLGKIQATIEVAIKGERSACVRAREFIYPYVDAEIKRTIAGEPEDEDKPVLGAICRSFYKACNGNKEYLYACRTRIANDLFHFTFAAVTNSYGMAAWVIFHILRNTGGVANAVSEEIRTSSPDADRFPNLEALMLEIARLYSPGSLMRLVIKDFELPSNGEIVPAGTMICTNACLLHRNEEVFSSPLEFRPARFQNDTELKKAGSSFVAFGAGMHPCTGRKFAIMEIALFVATAMEYFDFELVGDDTRKGDPFAEKNISNVPRHPKLDASQNNSIWRPTEPVLLHYKRKAIENNRNCRI